MTLWLHGLGHYHPENEITNRFLEELDIGTDDAWIVERVGIRSRRTVLPLDYIAATRNVDPRAAAEAAQYRLAELGRRAAELALARAGVAKADVGMVIAASSVPDTVSPAEACNVACALDIDVPAVDVASACTSFLAQLHLVSMMDPARVPELVLLVVVEGLTRVVDYRDRATAVLWGDGAAAAVVSTRARGRAEIAATSLDSSPRGADRVVVPRTGHFAQQGRAVQAFAIRRTGEVLERVRKEAASPTRRFHFVGHQANLRVLESVCRAAAIPDDRHHHNVEWYGNTAAASGPSVVSMAWDRWTAEDDVALVGVGAGLTWAGCLLRFGAPS